MTTAQATPAARRRRPLIRWYGGKWRIAPWIIEHLPPHRVYVEPFGGGGSVLLRKARSYAEVYNDLDGEVVNLFAVARDRGGELERAVRLTPFARNEFMLAYEPSADPVEQARRTLLRSYAGHGSNAHNQATGFRANTTRAGSTPAHDWWTFPETLAATVERLRGVVIENRDATDVMQRHDSPETLHYVDPPYVQSTRVGAMSRKNVYRHEMTDQEHRVLATVLHALIGAVVLSGYACALYDDLYADWRRVERVTHADCASKRTEVLWIKPVTS